MSDFMIILRSGNPLHLADRVPADIERANSWRKGVGIRSMANT
nr:hypothetical protein [uncultured Sphingomonas sp.]